jgi:hypothetical protein
MPARIPLKCFINILGNGINFHNFTISQKPIIIVLMEACDNPRQNKEFYDSPILYFYLLDRIRAILLFNGR